MKYSFLRQVIFAAFLLALSVGCASKSITIKTKYRVCPDEQIALDCPLPRKMGINTVRQLRENRDAYKLALDECRAALEAWRKAWSLCSEKWHER